MDIIEIYYTEFTELFAPFYAANIRRKNELSNAYDILFVSRPDIFTPKYASLSAFPFCSRVRIEQS
jgi:hypothetical protein